MKVAVTGGTGFVGSHTVAELLRSGHRVKLLVRSERRLKPALDPFGVTQKVEVAIGDVTDRESVEKFLKGSEAVINAAAVYTHHPGRQDVVRTTNVTGAENVIGAAHRLGLDPIVHVSSLASFYGRPAGRTVGPDTEPGHPGPTYSRSKADSDRVARRYQSEGAPVVITYPGMVWGPDDPYFGDTCITARNILNRSVNLIPSGVIATTDVRDVARLHAAVLAPGKGARRYIAPAHNPRFLDIHKQLGRVTGRFLPSLQAPGWWIVGALAPLYALEGLLKIRSPWNYSGAHAIASGVIADDSRTKTELGLTAIPFEDSIRDTVRWMAQAGHISKRMAGKAVA